jgi:hypothetical protein
MSNNTVTSRDAAELAQAREMAGPGATAQQLRDALACVVVARWLREGK